MRVRACATRTENPRGARASKRHHFYVPTRPLSSTLDILCVQYTAEPGRLRRSTIATGEHRVQQKAREQCRQDLIVSMPMRHTRRYVLGSHTGASQQPSSCARRPERLLPRPLLAPYGATAITTSSLSGPTIGVSHLACEEDGNAESRPGHAWLLDCLSSTSLVLFDFGRVKCWAFLGVYYRHDG